MTTYDYLVKVKKKFEYLSLSHIYIGIYLYIYIEREIERKTETLSGFLKNATKYLRYNCYEHYSVLNDSRILY